MTNREDILKQVHNIPSLPSVVVKLQGYLNDPDVSFGELARIIEYDPGLTANVLQLANSAYFGWSRTIKSVQEAITRLGTHRIFQMVLCMSVAPLVRKPIKGYDMDAGALWQHSLATAVCAEQLVEALGLGNMPEAFTAGMLHDMGKVVLGTFVDVDDEPIKEIMESDNLAFNEAELMVLGIDHAEVAGELLESWSLPAEVVEAARWHHRPAKADKAHQRIVDLVHVADVLCINVGWGMGGDSLKYKLDERATARLDMGVGVAEDVILKVMLAMEELKDLYKPSREGEPHGVQHSTR